MGFGCVQQLDAAEERAKTMHSGWPPRRGKAIDFFGPRYGLPQRD